MKPARAARVRREEFDGLYQRFSREVWAVAYARWQDADLAMDFTQEAFLRLWREQEQGEKIDNPRGWLIRVVRNLAEDYAKSSFGRNGTQGVELFAGVKGKTPGPLENLAERELCEKVRGLIAELPQADRDVLVLRYALDYEPAAIAELLELKVDAVYMRLSRARSRFAERAKQTGVSVSQ